MTEVPPSPGSGGNTLNYQEAERSVPVHGMTLVVLSILAVSVFCFGVMGAGYYMYADGWAQYGAGRPVPYFEREYSWFFIRVGNVAAPVSVLITVVCVLMWVHRAYRRVGKIAGVRLRFTPFWAVIYWVAPYKCFVVPFVVMKEMYTISRGISRTAFTPLVGCWWGSWMLAHFMYLLSITAGSQRERGVSEAEAISDWATWQWLPAPLYLTAGVLLMCLV